MIKSSGWFVVNVAAPLALLPEHHISSFMTCFAKALVYNVDAWSLMPRFPFTVWNFVRMSKFVQLYDLQRETHSLFSLARDFLPQKLANTWEQVWVSTDLMCWNWEFPFSRINRVLCQLHQKGSGPPWTSSMLMLKKNILNFWPFVKKKNLN